MDPALKESNHDLVDLSLGSVLFSIHKSINIIHHTSKVKDKNYMITLMDAESI